MKRIYFITISLLSFFYFTFSHAAINANIDSCRLITEDIQIRKLVQSLEKLPAGKDLIRKSTAHGSISILTNPRCYMPFEAMWDGEHRRILIDGKRNMDHGRILRSLIFELHNAAADPEFDEVIRHACRGSIDCDAFVEESERIEHNNVLKTVAIIKEGIARGIFPASTHWEVIEDFDIHYKIQQIAGHSQFLAKEYETLKPRHYRSRPFSGTIQGLSEMTENQKMALVRKLYSQIPKFRHH